ncbi:hypothetical protein SAMN04487969_101112 [Paenibacillus algorifonticola]|uniref:Uncharacterized protein n=1 Tax=Paenibacillus algorifonticola TaxID=684063 RepID=A0A1I1XV40_9BACL|nr:hypothetical protein [Paenibacillus algorifonticola]SFE11162.1 hypothetical protein SAMN04487969_101112 [Paenibacillus algorifonticola]
MTLKLSIVDGVKSVDLELEQTESGHVTAVINGAFSVFGVNLASVPAPATEVIAPELTITKTDLDFIFGPERPDLKAKQVKEIEQAKEELTKKAYPVPEFPPVPVAKVEIPAKERPRTLPLIGSARTPMVSLEEKIQAVINTGEARPVHWETGIKFKEGIPHYRCYYRCKSCGNKGNHYIKLDDTEVTCHNCKSAYSVLSATGVEQDGIPERDGFGNFFVSGRLL